MRDFHPLQLLILQKLMYSNGLKYSDMKPKTMEGSRFTFHLDKLVHGGFIIKLENKYVLSSSGKELANRMDLGDVKIESQAKVSVIMVCLREKTEKREYLLYTRLKSPFYKYQGFPTGKVKRGEDIISAAKRELKEETGLTGDPKLFSVLHYKIFDTNKKLLEDKIFFACKFVSPIGNLVGGREGEYKWVDSSKVWGYLKKPVQEIKDLFEVVDGDHISFIEKEYSTTGF